MINIPNCLDEPKDYFYDEFDEEYTCLRCKDNFVWSWYELSCIECGEAFEGCSLCMNNTCHKCEDPQQFPTFLMDGCMDPIENCADLIIPHEYEVIEDNYVCSQCLDGFYQDEYTNECYSCDDEVNMCTSCYQEWGSVFCSECGGGLMPEYDQMYCIPRFDHCADADLDEQPLNLAVDEDYQMYYCETCEDGFYWDEDLMICGECSVENCELCSDYNTCDTCQEGFIVQLDQRSCFPPIQNCKVPTTIQPQGLFKNHDLQRYECAACKTGFVPNPENGECDHCSNLLSGCLVCQDSETCLQC